MKKGVARDRVLEHVYGKIPNGGQKLTGFSVGGVQLPENDIKTLKTEATYISNTMLWKLLLDRGYFSAQVEGIDNAKDFYDTVRAQGKIKALALIESELQTLIDFKLDK